MIQLAGEAHVTRKQLHPVKGAKLPADYVPDPAATNMENGEPTFKAESIEELHTYRINYWLKGRLYEVERQALSPIAALKELEHEMLARENA